MRRERSNPGVPVPSSGRRPSARFRSEWARLEREVRACRRCPNYRSRLLPVLYRGTATPRIVFVGEAPGATEDRLGVPFVGRSGRKLDTAIERAGLAPSEYGVLNLIKCRPPGNRFRRASAVACRPFLDRQLDLLAPEVLVPLGREALHALDPAAPPVLKAAGHPRRSGPHNLFPLVHPAATLRSRAMAERWDRDWTAFAQWFASGVAARAREPP
jgi:uracil-DNA glycosylase family 4